MEQIGRLRVENREDKSPLQIRRDFYFVQKKCDNREG